MNISQRWWGHIGGPLHAFDTLVGPLGETLIRVAPRAACGWRPDRAVLESPEELGTRECARCLSEVHHKPCPECDGAGMVEVCALGHAVCPCPVVRRDCPDCDGAGRVPKTDEEIAATEGLGGP